jgi:hypothetical protein
MSNGKLIPVYTVSKVDKECNQYGKKHWSNDGEITFCGKALNESWFIINNTVDGQSDCKVPPAEDDKLKHIQKQNAELREQVEKESIKYKSVTMEIYETLLARNHWTPNPDSPTFSADLIMAVGKALDSVTKKPEARAGRGEIKDE